MVTRILRRREFPHFYHYPPSPLLLKAFQSLADRELDVVDLGCGDGAKLFALQQQGLLKKARRIIGVDMDASRLTKLTAQVPGAEGIEADATSVSQLDTGCADLVICSMLMEHVPDDRALAREVCRLLRPDGLAFITTVIKRRYGFWIYRRDGRFTLAPEHLREYASARAVLDIVRAGGLAVRDYRLFPIGGLSPAEVSVFLLVNFGLMKEETAPDYFTRSRFRRRLAGLRVPFVGPIGFSAIHILAQTTQPGAPATATPQG